MPLARRGRSAGDSDSVAAPPPARLLRQAVRPGGRLLRRAVGRAGWRHPDCLAVVVGLRARGVEWQNDGDGVKGWIGGQDEASQGWRATHARTHEPTNELTLA